MMTLSVRERYLLLAVLLVVLALCAVAVFAFLHPMLMQHVLADGPDVINRHG